MIVPAIVPALAYFTYLGLQVDDATTLWGTELVQGAGVPIWYRPLRFYYPIALFAGMAPWLLLLGATGYDVWKRRELAALLIASCVLVALLLISFSGKLRFHYVLPLMPLCAALIAWSSLRWYDAADNHTVNPRLLRWLVWGQLTLVGLLAPVFAYAVMKSNARELTVPPIPWMLVAGGLFLAAALAAKRRNLNWFAAALIANVLFTWGAFSWIGLDTSRQSTTAYRFVKDVAARLPEDSLLYFDSGRPAFFQYYFNRGEIESYTLHHWARDGAAKPLPYFIVESGQIRKAGIKGEVLLAQQIDDDDAMVLFRPDPANP